MNLVSQEKLLESILILSSEIKDMKNDTNCSDRQRNKVSSEITERFDSLLRYDSINTKDGLLNTLYSNERKTLGSFTDLPLLDVEIFSPFITDDEFEKEDVIKSAEADYFKRQIHFHNYSELALKRESLKMLLPLNEVRSLPLISHISSKCHSAVTGWINLVPPTNITQTITNQMILKRNYCSSILVTLFQSKRMKDAKSEIINAKIGMHDSVSTGELVKVACENTFINEEFKYSILDEIHHKINFNFKYEYSTHFSHCIYMFCDQLVILSKLNPINFQKQCLPKSDYKENNVFISTERTENYLSKCFVKNPFETRISFQDLIVFETFIHQSIFYRTTLIKLQYSKTKTFNSFELISSSRNSYTPIGNISFTIENSRNPISIGLDLMKHKSSQTNKNCSNLLTDSRNFMSHCVMHNKYLDYLLIKLTDKIVNIIRSSTKIYLLLKCEVALANKYITPAIDILNLSLSTNSSQDAAIYKVCKDSRKSRRKINKKLNKNLIIAQIKNERKESESKNSTTDKPFSENTICETKQITVHDLKNQINTKIHNAIDRTLQKNINASFHCVSTPSIANKTESSQKLPSDNPSGSTAMDNCLSKKIDLFLKDYSTEYFNKRKNKINKLKMNFKTKYLHPSSKLFENLYSTAKSEIILKHSFVDSDSNYQVNDSNRSLIEFSNSLLRPFSKADTMQNLSNLQTTISCRSLVQSNDLSSDRSYKDDFVSHNEQGVSS